MKNEEFLRNLRERWGESHDGRSLEMWHEEAICQLRSLIEHWSYCTTLGMKESCPEKVEVLADDLLKIGIAPHAIRNWR